MSKDSIMHTDGFASYDGLVDWGCKHHYRVSRGENEFVERGNPGNRIDGIESFWGYAKNRLVKYQGIPKEDFYLHLKEREFRFNMRGAGHVQIHASGTPGKAPKLGKPHFFCLRGHSHAIAQQRPRHPTYSPKSRRGKQLLGVIARSANTAYWDMCS